MNDIDQIRLNFSEESLFTLNIILGFIMYGVALELSLEDFKRVFRKPKAPLIGIFSQFLFPAGDYLCSGILFRTYSQHCPWHDAGSGMPRREYLEFYLFIGQWQCCFICEPYSLCHPGSYHPYTY